ncbi:MAG: hypothetical protein GX410_06035 [Elusimicrobia bacterium]|nr:hypothetical protein [Elusimicrobiota bacterium]
MPSAKKIKASSSAKPVLLAILPFLPSASGGRSEAALFRFLTALSSRFEVKCVPEGPPTATRLAEAALSAKGMKIYALGKPPQRAELDAGIRAVITENHSAPVVLVCGLDLINRHLFQLRLFAQDRKFAALLLPEDLGKLDFSGLNLAERTIKKADLIKTLSHANAVLCCDSAAAAKLQAAARFPVLGPAQGLREINALFRPQKPRRIGVVLLPQAYKMAAPLAAMLKRQPVTARFFKVGTVAEAAARIMSGRGTESWLLLCRAFTCSPEIPGKLLFMSELFRDAGAVMPAVLRKLDNAHALPHNKMLAEAFALSRRGLFREPFYINEPAVLCLNRGALLKTGGTDTRFSSPDYALTDLCLRMYQAGHRTITAEDLAVFTEGAAKTAKADTEERQLEKETLARKWCMESLKFMELLVSELHANS